MEKDIVVKVTRLRNTLPLETEDVKSPSTQSTPTKKRGGRLTTKPQLELIHENATEEIQPKKTRKSTVKVVEPDEKVMTPSRRSTRIRSNTSNVSETPTEAEDKGTPSRRSTRIRSNTSLIAETAQFENSPRARRAARRTSLVGSDNESTVTPVKQTRRTRRDSTSSIDKKAGSNVSKLEIQPNLVIIEEKTNKDEDETKAKDASSEDINDSPNIRKSPRLVEKSAKQSLSRDGNNKENEPDSVKTDEKSNSDIKTDNFVESSTVQIEQNIVNEVNNLSKSSSNFSSDLGIKSKKKNPALNYTTSALDKPKSESKRQRTKSWTTISSSRRSDHCFLSDSEAMKKKPTMEDTTYKSYNTSGSGDGLLNASKDKGDKNNSFNHSAISENITNSNRISTTTLNTEVMNLDNSTSKLNHSSDKNDSKQYGRVVLGNSPKCLVKSIVFLEDSDSNASNTDKVNVNYGTNAEDQCVPVVKHQLQVAESQNNLSYEPMDIDETITENASLLIFTNNNPAQETQNNSILLNNSHDNNTKKVEKFSSKTSNLEDDKDRSLNKSKKMSDKDITSDDNEKVCKSKRKSSNSSIKVVKRENDTNLSKTYSTSFTITNNDDITKSSSNMEADCNMSINANKLSFNQDHDNTTKVIKSNRKSSICDTSADGNNVKKSNRKSLINNIDNNTSILSSGLVKVDYKCIEEPMCDDHDIINDPKKRSKRISLSADGEVEHPKSKDDGSKISNDDTINISSNNCKMSSSLKNVHDIMAPNANNSKRDSLTSNDIINVKNSNVAENETMTDVINKHESKSKGSKKDKRSIMSNKDNDNADESVNISSRKSSISQASSSQSLDNSNNENKSTLVLSQIKNTSETNFEYNEPLSKSLDVSIVKKDIEKKNLSIAYSTSTPLQQKSSKNSGMQINTSNISSEKKDVSIKGNKKATVLPNHEETQSSNEDNVEEDSDENDEEETEDKSIFIDAEAKDANDDYESGDSRDEDEKEYEEQNEIIEEGESLDSEEEDFSDDSEYEKDSFVVDSDEEDNNLLSGSDNDLSMSADELTMSAKSKNKFNARKVKEQKKASREMFNARHEGNESSNSISNKHITKKVNRQRLESSDSDVEKEKHNLQPKRSKRARIDSSQDISMTQSDADKLVSVKKKKIRCLSDSVCEDNAVENEITIDKSISPDDIDPLSLQNVVKQEPNISQKDLNISTIAITNADEFEKVEIDVNVSLIRAKSNLSLDPLQNTMAQDNARDSEESISENEEITKGYDSVLNNLNTIKLKTADTSLNIHKKGKPKSKEPIVDELNLTQIKSKKAKNKLSDENAEKQNVSQKITNKIMANITNSTNHDEDSSDSIDMKLLFNDSSDSENKITVEEVPESYIPLKRTEGKINILESIGGETENVSFFIDTTGTHTENMKDENNDDSSVKTSGKKKKKTSTSFADTEQAKDTEQPLNISITGSTKKKKNKLSSTFDKQETESESHISISSNDKKEKNKVPFDEQRTGEPELNINVTDSNKKKKNKLSLSVDEQKTEQQELNIRVTGSKKKNKLHLSFDEQETAEPTAEEAVINTSASNVKKQKQKNTSKNIVENDILGEPVLEQAIDDEPVYSVKKQKHKDTSKSLVELENVIEGNEIVTDLTEEATSQKRKRKRSANHSISQEAIQNSDTLKLPNESVIASNDKKKRKFSHKENETATISQDTTKKDKKRKHSDNDDNVSKDNKHDSSEKHLVPRLPTKILKQLDDKPKKDNNNLPKGNFISTTSFKVEKTDKKRMKPSNYLEQSVYLNDSIEEETKKFSLFQPKVCPSVPTVSLSNQGFTTNFKVDVIPQNTQFIFIGKSNDVPNFKQDFLHKHRIKKFGTFDMYKRRRNVKLSKF